MLQTASPAARKLSVPVENLLFLLCSFCMFRCQTRFFKWEVTVRICAQLIDTPSRFKYQIHCKDIVMSVVDDIMKLDVHVNENYCNKHYYFSYSLPHSDDDNDNSVFSSCLLQ